MTVSVAIKCSEGSVLACDHGKWGDHPHAKNVCDVDSVHLIRLYRNMVENSCLVNGKNIKPAPIFYIGSADNSFAGPARDVKAMAR
jgi:methylenetetrahydrofolate reductase (NADPH)